MRGAWIALGIVGAGSTAFGLGTGSPPWNFEAVLVPGSAGAGSIVGSAVDVSGDTLVVGATLHDPGGAAWIYRYRATGWEELVELQPLAPRSFEAFGAAVGIDGDTVAVGAPWDGDVAPQQGSVSVFREVAGVWSLEATLTLPDPTERDHFGQRLALQSDRLVVGADDHDGVALNGGAAYVFERSGTVWSFTAKLVPADPQNNAEFGAAIALDGDTVMVGAPEDNNPGQDEGAAYVFHYDGTSWSQEQKLGVGDTIAEDEFGWAVAVHGDNAIAGAPFWGLSEEGAAYAYDRVSSNWSLVLPRLQTPPDGTQQWDNFGRSMAMQAGELLVGAPNGQDPQSRPGAVHAYERVGSAWVHIGRLLAPDAMPFDGFGAAVAMDGALIVVGANQRDLPAAGTGAVYVFRRDPGGVAYCAGDGTGPACPCGNTGAPGHGCDNAQGTGGVELAMIDFDPDGAGGGLATLTGAGYPPASTPTAVVIRSPLPGAAFLGDGLLCLTPPVVRFGASFASGGVSTHAVNHGAGAGTFHYQLWYRNTPGTFCDPTATFNASNGLRVTWP